MFDMNRYLLIPLFLLVTAYSVWFYKANTSKANSAPVQTEVGLDTELDSNKLWNLIQDWREKSGYIKYEKSDILCDVANKRAEYLLTNGDDNHMGFFNMNFAYEVSENYILDAFSERNALSGWKSSSGHLATLKRDYKYSCVSTKENVAVQIFSNL